MTGVAPVLSIPRAPGADSSLVHVILETALASPAQP